MDSITDSMDTSWSEPWETVDSGDGHAAAHVVTKSWRELSY